MTDRPSPEQDSETGRFLPGNNGGPGRPKGARVRLADAFCDDLLAEWSDHGRDAITRMRQEKPGDFVKVVASILPKEMNLRVNQFDDMSDDDLARELASISAQLAALGDSNGARIALPPTDEHGAEQPARVH